MEQNTLIHRQCLLCGGSDSSLYLEKGGMRLLRCRKCWMIYASPVAAKMGGSYYDELGRPFYLSPEKLESDFAGVRFERELRLFQRFCPRGAVLDVGCSTGAFLFQLKKRGDYDVAGVDVSKPALDYARCRRLEIIEDSFLNHDFGEMRFAAVTFWAVIEHLLEPARFLQKTASVLGTGGHCFILVPNMKSLAVRLLGAKYRYIFPQHVNYFTIKTLEALALKQDFEIVERGSMHFNPIVIWQDFRSRGEFVPDEQRAALLKRTTAYKQKTILKPVKALYRLVETCLGAAHLADNVYLVLRK